MLMRMLTGLSGPTLSLAPGAEHDFDDIVVDDEGRTEAQRLQLAGYAEPLLDQPSPAIVEADVEPIGPIYDAAVSLPGAGDLDHDWARADLPPALASAPIAAAPAAAKAPAKRARKAKA